MYVHDMCYNQCVYTRRASTVPTLHASPRTTSVDYRYAHCTRIILCASAGPDMYLGLPLVRRQRLPIDPSPINACACYRYTLYRATSSAHSTCTCYLPGRTRTYMCPPMSSRATELRHKLQHKEQCTHSHDEGVKARPHPRGLQRHYQPYLPSFSLTPPILCLVPCP